MCERKVVAMTRRDGSDVEVKCGSYFGGEKLFCLTCQNKYEREYPQGWVAYPGDVCRHGTYVGGCGVDHICGRCETEDLEAENTGACEKCGAENVIVEPIPMHGYSKNLCERCANAAYASHEAV